MSGELIERLLATACFLANDDADLLSEAADALSTSEAARLKAEGEVARLAAELAEAGMYTEAHERLDDLAREAIAERLKAEARVKVLEEGLGVAAWRFEYTAKMMRRYGQADLAPSMDEAATDARQALLLEGEGDSSCAARLGASSAPSETTGLAGGGETP